MLKVTVRGLLAHKIRFALTGLAIVLGLSGIVGSFMVRDGLDRTFGRLVGVINEGVDEVEFVTLLRFDSMDAVKEFAGADESKPVIYPKAEALLTRMDDRSRHYRVAI